MTLAEIKQNYSIDWQKFIDEEAEEIQKRAKRYRRRISWTDACQEAEILLETWVNDAQEESKRLNSILQIAHFVASHRRAKVWCTLMALAY